MGTTEIAEGTEHKPGGTLQEKTAQKFASEAFESFRTNTACRPGSMPNFTVDELIASLDLPGFSEVKGVATEVQPVHRPYKPRTDDFPTPKVPTEPAEPIPEKPAEFQDPVDDFTKTPELIDEEFGPPAEEGEIPKFDEWDRPGTPESEPSAPGEQPTPGEHPTPGEQAPPREPAPATEPTPTTEPVPASKPAPAVEPAPVSEPGAEPLTAPKSSFGRTAANLGFKGLGVLGIFGGTCEIYHGVQSIHEGKYVEGSVATTAGVANSTAGVATLFAVTSPAAASLAVGAGGIGAIFDGGLMVANACSRGDTATAVEGGVRMGLGALMLAGGPVAMGAGAAYLGWCVGDMIGNVKVGEKSINQHVTDALASWFFS